MDAPLLLAGQLREYWRIGQKGGYEVFIARPLEMDPEVLLWRARALVLQLLLAHLCMSCSSERELTTKQCPHVYVDDVVLDRT